MNFTRSASLSTNTPAQSTWAAFKHDLIAMIRDADDEAAEAAPHPVGWAVPGAYALLVDWHPADR